MTKSVDEVMDLVAYQVKTVSELKEWLPIMGQRIISLDGEGGTFYTWKHPAGGYMTFDTAWGEFTWFETAEALQEQLIDEE